MSPISSHVSVAVFNKLPPEYCTRSFSFESALLIVTPAPSATVTCPAPMPAKSMTVPTGNAVVLFGGTVAVMAAAFESVTKSRASESAKVYVVPVCAFIAGTSRLFSNVGAAPVPFDCRL
jgi:hypothetical protein